jgi:hypothetical protein
MAAEEVRRVRTGAELSVGDEIEAWHNGKLFHRGCVSQTVASMDLVWIRDARTGARRLIDVEALVIIRASTPATATTATATASAMAAAGTATTATAGMGTATRGTAGTATATAGTASPGTVAAAKGATEVRAQPSSHVPLFHGPGLAT